MTIYIEKFIIQNILINFCFIKLIHSLTKINTKFIKIVIASIFGAIINIFSVYFLNSSIALNLLKIINIAGMLLIAFKQSKKQLAYNLILFLFLTFTLYGVTVSMSSQTYYTSFGMITTSKFNLELICLLIIVATYIFDLVLRHLPCKIHTNKLIYNLTLFKDNKSIKINAYLDTGNFINQNGQPVLILDLNTFLNLTQMNLCDFLLNKSETISTSTVNGDNKLKLFQVDKIQIQQKNFKNELKNQLVAISLNNCFKNTNYQALLSPLFL